MLRDDLKAFMDGLYTRKNGWEFVLQKRPDNEQAQRELAVLNIVIPAVEQAAKPYQVVQ